MNRDQAINALEELCMLFPNADLQQAELDAVVNRIGKFDHTMFVEVVRDHRLRNDYNRPKIAQIITEAERRHSTKHGRPEDAKPAATHADVIRAIWIANGDHRAAGWSDAEVYCRHYACVAQKAMIERCTTAGDKYRVISPNAVIKITVGCVGDLVAAGIARELAMAWAQSIVDPQLSPDAFNDLLDDARRAPSQQDDQLP